MPLLDTINPYVEDTLATVGVTDEPPTVPAADHATDDEAAGAAGSQGGHE
jgi:NADH-quinone oxidoreductase subunit M